MTTLSPALKTRILEDGLVSTVKDLQDVGHTILIVQAAPDFEYPYAFDPQKCLFGDLLTHTCRTEMPRMVADSIQNVERSSLDRVALASGARIFDPRDFFCRGGTCVTERDGVVLYRDAFHISVEASRQLAPAFAKAIGSSQ